MNRILGQVEELRTTLDMQDETAPVLRRHRPLPEHEDRSHERRSTDAA